LRDGQILVYVRQIARPLGCFRRQSGADFMHRATCVNLKPSYHFARERASREDGLNFCIM
jgi:hypothetical protein